MNGREKRARSRGDMRGAISLLGALVVAVGAITLGAQGVARSPVGAAEPGYCSGNTAITIAPTIPTNFPFNGKILGQQLADCLAWQEFVYLNWAGVGGKPASAPASQFGAPVTDPNAHPTTVWESYNTAAVAFGITPHTNTLTLGGRNEFLNAGVRFNGVNQVGGGWITGQNGLLTFYDIWLDTDEDQYINDPANGLGGALRLAKNQLACVHGPVGLQLPIGGGKDVTCGGRRKSYGNAIGAIEVKAAFLDMSTTPKAELAKYLVFQANLCYPITYAHPSSAKKCVVSPGRFGYNEPGWLKENATLGLVGLHIVHKMAGAQQMLWATFEHVDNDPETKTTTGHWNFYDPHATTQPVGDTPPVPCPTPGCTPWNTPTQIVRFTPIDSNARGATGSFYAALAAAGANASVFRNYELVQVQWPAASVSVAPGAAAPLTLGGAVPAAPAPVANSVIETYMQQPDAANDHSCMSCHSGGTIAASSSSVSASTAVSRARTIIPIFSQRRRALVAAGASPVPQPTGTPYASDYSFLFGDLGR